MSTSLRAFNDAGIAEFHSHLERVRTSTADAVPPDLYLSDEYSGIVSPEVQIRQVVFETKLEAARYLFGIVQQQLSQHFENVGLWTWLSAFYFDSVCPVEEDGARKPRSDYRHILQPGRDWWHFYRHLLAGPVRTYAFHGEEAKLLLSGPVHRMGDFVEQLCSRQEIAANRGLVEAATRLYWDDKSQRPKRGAAPNRRKPGTLRRFVDIIQQLELTYDLYSMNGAEILTLLPNEFASWGKPAKEEGT